MVTVTKAQLLSRGFVLVNPSEDGLRIQRWSGVSNGEAFEVLWDSVSQRSFPLPRSFEDPATVMKALITLAFSVQALTTASTLGAAGKAAIQSAVDDAIRDVLL